MVENLQRRHLVFRGGCGQQPRHDQRAVERRVEDDQLTIASCVSASLSSAHLRLAVVLDPDALDQRQLRLEPVDVLFLGFEDVLEQLA